MHVSQRVPPAPRPRRPAPVGLSSGTPPTTDTGDDGCRVLAGAQRHADGLLHPAARGGRGGTHAGPGILGRAAGRHAPDAHAGRRHRQPLLPPTGRPHGTPLPVRRVEGGRRGPGRGILTREAMPVGRAIAQAHVAVRNEAAGSRARSVARRRMLLRLPRAPARARRFRAATHEAGASLPRPDEPLHRDRHGRGLPPGDRATLSRATPPRPAASVQPRLARRCRHRDRPQRQRGRLR